MAVWENEIMFNLGKRFKIVPLDIVVFIVMLFLFSVFFIKKELTPPITHAANPSGISDNCQHCLDSMPLCYHDDGFFISFNTHVKPDQLCTDEVTIGGVEQKKNGFSSILKSSIPAPCTKEEVKKYRESWLPKKKEVNIPWAEEEKYLVDLKKHKDCVANFPPPSNVPKLKNTSLASNLLCMGCLSSCNLRSFGTTPYTCLKKCIDAKSCQVAAGEHACPSEPKMPIPRESCPVEKRDYCKNCSTVKIQSRGGCKSLWKVQFKSPKKEDDPSGGKNQLDFGDTISKYLQDKHPTSPFLKISDNPGRIISNVSMVTGINPLILLSISAVTTDWGTSGSSMECGNPWKQKPPVPGRSSVCVSSNGKQWFEYNKEHQVDVGIIYSQAERIRRTYVDNYSIRTLEQFVNEYNKRNADDPAPLKLEELEAVMQGLFKMTSKYLKCGSGNGNLGSIDEIPDELKEIFEAAGEEFQVSPAMVAAIYSCGEHGCGWPADDGGPCSGAGACGPFQFMPGTWEGHKQDGDNDGDMEINSLWDSAFAAAHKMAADGGAPFKTEAEAFMDVASRYNCGGTWSQGECRNSETINYIERTVPQFEALLSQM